MPPYACMQRFQSFFPSLICKKILPTSSAISFNTVVVQSRLIFTLGLIEEITKKSYGIRRKINNVKVYVNGLKNPTCSVFNWTVVLTKRLKGLPERSVSNEKKKRGKGERLPGKSWCGFSDGIIEISWDHGVIVPERMRNFLIEIEEEVGEGRGG